MDRFRLPAAIALAAGTLAIAACGGDDGGGQPAQGGGSSDDAQAIKLGADPGGALKFDKTELNAKAGKVTIDFDNPAEVPHAVEVEGNGVEEESETITKGKAKLSVDLDAGEYDFYCPVGKHREKGMEGKLTVE